MPKPTKQKLQRMVALLRGINVGGNRRVPMAELRSLAEGAGLEEVSTYIQSGNVVFTSAQPTLQVERALESAIVAYFGFEVPVIVRTASDWAGYARGSPFPEAEAGRSNLLHLALSKAPPAEGAEGLLQQRSTAGERVKIIGDAVWVDFAAGVARSKLTPGFLDKAVGSTVTARNWKSVLQLAEMLRAPATKG